MRTKDVAAYRQEHGKQLVFVRHLKRDVRIYTASHACETSVRDGTPNGLLVQAKFEQLLGRDQTSLRRLDVSGTGVPPHDMPPGIVTNEGEA
jgi:hypothetical protein